MENSTRYSRQPVALQFFVQDGYSEEVLRLIEYEILYIEKGQGTLFLNNSDETVSAGDIIVINPFEEHYFKVDYSVGSFHCYRLDFW